MMDKGAFLSIANVILHSPASGIMTGVLGWESKLSTFAHSQGLEFSGTGEISIWEEPGQQSFLTGPLIGAFSIGDSLPYSAC